MVEDWVLLEAAKRIYHASGNLPAFRCWYRYSGAFRALCDNIAKYEQPPVDPLLIEARKICADAWTRNREPEKAEKALRGEEDSSLSMGFILQALRRGMELAKDQA